MNGGDRGGGKRRNEEGREGEREKDHTRGVFLPYSSQRALVSRPISDRGWKWLCALFRSCV